MKESRTSLTKFSNKALFEKSGMEVINLYAQGELSLLGVLYFNKYFSDSIHGLPTDEYGGAFNDNNPSEKDLEYIKSYMVEYMEANPQDTVEPSAIQKAMCLYEDSDYYSDEGYEEWEEILDETYNRLKQYGDRRPKVYIVENELGHIKIGYTRSNVNTRINNLQTGSSLKIILIKAFDCSECPDLEYQLHKMFKNYNINGEWFEAPVKEMALDYCESKGLYEPDDWSRLT